jgi:prepilin-type N-terminal cleavage/methylation domain-containing protein
MKPGHIGRQGFTLIEMLLALSVGSLMLAAIVVASVCLQKVSLRSTTSLPHICSRSG